LKRPPDFKMKDKENILKRPSNIKLKEKKTVKRKFVSKEYLLIITTL